ncbi:MAG: response regulator [Bacteroidetes bacterium]|jgi:CheY-like chemotaxis protein|nr:response regulator [Bacteroidota bacterium]
MGLSFILIENLEIDLYIAHKLIKMTMGDDALIETFTSAEDALDHIAATKIKKADRTIILLDLMMPRLNGADFISLFEALPEQITDHYQIVIVTSSMNKAELDRLGKKKNVENVIAKPLTQEKFKAVLEQIQIDINGK